MDIAVVHNTAPGGSKRALYEHLRGLAARGHRLHAFVPIEAEENYLPIRPLCATYRVYGQEGEQPRRANSDGTEGGKLRQVVLQVFGPDIHDLLRDAVWVHRQRRVAQNIALRYEQMAADIVPGHYDLLYVHQCMVRLAPDVLRHVQGIPTVFFVQDTLRRAHEWPAETLPDYDTFEETLVRKKRTGHIGTGILHGWRQYEDNEATSNLRSAHHVLVNSYYSREAFLRTTGVSAQVNYLGVDTDFFTPVESKERGGQPEVLSVGALRPEKRHGFILDAIALLPPEIRPRLRIIGYGLSDGKGGRSVTSRQLYQQAEEQGVELIIDEEVSDTILRNAYRRAAVFAFAPRLEPFGLVMLEAMACGVPTIAVREAGPRETVRDGVTGFLTDANPEAFATGLSRILTNPALAEEMGKAARQVAVSCWTWERSVDEVETILQNVAASW